MKILHLYHDLMNLYGDYANIVAIEKLARLNSIEYSVDKLSVGDDINPEEYDFVYIGSGTERNLKVMLEDMRRYADELKRYIDSGKPMLMTGNSFEALGASVTDCDGKEYEGLGIFGFTSVEQNKKRIVGDVIYECGFLDSPLVGFVNKCSEISGITDTLFSVKMGPANAEGDSCEGTRKNNLFCTHLTGPILVKNPHMLRYMLGLITSADIDDSALTYEHKGYEVTLTELNKRLGS